MSDKNLSKSPATDLDQVRDILFGESERRMEQRFRDLDQRLDREFSELRAELHSRCQAIEAGTKEKFEAAQQRLTNTEQSLRFFTNEQTNEVRRVFGERQDALQQELQAMLGKLSERTTDRTILSQLLQDMAGRLRDEERE